MNNEKKKKKKKRKSKQDEICEIFNDYFVNIAQDTGKGAQSYKQDVLHNPNAPHIRTGFQLH